MCPVKKNDLLNSWSLIDVGQSGAIWPYCPFVCCETRSGGSCGTGLIPDSYDKYDLTSHNKLFVGVRCAGTSTACFNGFKWVIVLCQMYMSWGTDPPPHLPLNTLSKLTAAQWLGLSYFYCRHDIQHAIAGKAISHSRDAVVNGISHLYYFDKKNVSTLQLKLDQLK